MKMVRATALALIFACANVFAADNVWQPGEDNAVWKSECGSCHMAFPPGLLTKASWQIMMQELDKHFGVSASLDEKQREEISAYLERNAGTGWTHASESLRITETAWFVKRHSGAISMLKKGRINSLVDCIACHN